MRRKDQSPVLNNNSSVIDPAFQVRMQKYQRE